MLDFSNIVGGCNKSKGLLLIIVAVLIVAVVIFGLWFIFWAMGKFMTKFGSDDGTAGFAADTNENVDPIVRFYIDNSHLRSDIDADLNFKIDNVVRVYEKFLANPGRYANDDVLYKAKEILEYINTHAYEFDRSRNSNARMTVVTYVRFMDRMLSQQMEALTNLSDNIPELRQIKKEYIKTGTDEGYLEYLNNFAIGDDKSLMEDQKASLKVIDYDPSRYVEDITDVSVPKGAKTFVEHSTVEGRRLKNRPYPGAHDNRVIPIENFEKESVNKDYAVPKPGIIKGIERNVETHNDYYDLRVRNVY